MDNKNKSTFVRKLMTDKEGTLIFVLIFVNGKNFVYEYKHQFVSLLSLPDDTRIRQNKITTEPKSIPAINPRENIIVTPFLYKVLSKR